MKTYKVALSITAYVIVEAEDETQAMIEAENGIELKSFSEDGSIVIDEWGFDDSATEAVEV